MKLKITASLCLALLIAAGPALAGPPAGGAASRPDTAAAPRLTGPGTADGRAATNSCSARTAQTARTPIPAAGRSGPAPWTPMPAGRDQPDEENRDWEVGEELC